MIDRPVCYLMPAPGKPWLFTIKSGYNDAVNERLRVIPGAVWDKQNKKRFMPIEFHDEVRTVLDGPFDLHDLVAPPSVEWDMSAPTPKVADRAHDFQKHHAMLVATTDGTNRFIEASEMGLGKSVIWCMAAQLRGIRRAIIVDMAMHRRDWFDPRRPGDNELDKWWPGHPRVELIESGRKAREADAPIRIVSYHLLNKLNLDLPVDAVVFDEFHMMSNPKTQWWKAANELINVKQRGIWVVGMTGTIQPDDIMTIWGELELLWPGRFGSKYDFGDRYSIANVNDFGKKEYAGTNEENVPEFRNRIGFMSARTTKPEVAHLLPAFTPRLVWYDPETKLDTIKEWVKSRFANGATHVCVLTHLRATAATLAKELGATTVLTGDVPTPKRHEELRRARDMEHSLIVATFHSIKEGVDLTFAPHALYAELYPRPVVMIQSLGRFHRMTSTEDADIGIMAREGGDSAAESLFNKIRAINMVLKAGTAETGMEAALAELKSLGLTVDEMNEVLRGHVLEQTDDDFGE